MCTSRRRWNLDDAGTLAAFSAPFLLLSWILAHLLTPAIAPDYILYGLPFVLVLAGGFLGRFIILPAITRLGKAGLDATEEGHDMLPPGF